MNDLNDRWTEHDHIVEGSLHEWLGQERPLPADRDQQIQTVLGRIHEAPGARRRLLRWLGRDATARRRREGHDIDFQTQPGRNRLMYSATGLVAVLAVLALSVNVITDTNEQLPAAGVVTLNVAADGSGEYGTIGEALDAAADGDTILVGPGTYQEALLIDKDVTITGDGPREDVVITGYADPAMWPVDGERECDYGTRTYAGCTALLADSDAAISDLTFRGAFAGVWVYGGAPVMERVTFEVVGRPMFSVEEEGGEALVVNDGSRFVLRDSLLAGSRDPRLRAGANALIEGNELTDSTSLIVMDAGPEAVIRGNHVNGSGSIFVWGETTALIEGNVIVGAKRHAIEIDDGYGAAEGYDPVLRGNVIEDSNNGILVVSMAEPTIEGTKISGVGTGIQVGGSTGVITDNEISDSQTGIVVVSGGAPTITDNVIDVTGRGIVVGKGTNPTIEGNDVCGGDVSIHVSDGATPQLGENQTCEGDVTG